MTTQPDQELDSMNTLVFARRGIIDFFRHQDVSEDHVLDLIDFQTHHMLSWNAQQKAALESAIVSFMKEGVLKKEHGYIVLTNTGFLLIYCSTGYGQNSPEFYG